MSDKAKFREEDSAGYRVDILGRNIDVTEPMRAYLWDKLDKIERFHTHIMHVQATLEICKMEHVCSLLLKIDHTLVKARAESTDMYVSIDRAIDRLQTLLARYKSRIQDHHQQKRSIIDMNVNVFGRPYDEVAEINEEIALENLREEMKEYEAPKLIGTETKPLKDLSIDEALMKIDLSGDAFLLFRSIEDGKKLKVLYRRRDGNYGLLQPE